MSSPYEQLYLRLRHEISVLNQRKQQASRYISKFTSYLVNELKFPESNINVFKHLSPEEEQEATDSATPKEWPVSLIERAITRDEEGDWVIGISIQLGNEKDLLPCGTMYLRPRVRVEEKKITLWSNFDSSPISFIDGHDSQSEIGKFISELRSLLEQSIELINKSPREQRRLIGFNSGQS